jgi:hypothetical protein
VLHTPIFHYTMVYVHRGVLLYVGCDSCQFGCQIFSFSWLLQRLCGLARQCCTLPGRASVGSPALLKRHQQGLWQLVSVVLQEWDSRRWSRESSFSSR